MLENVSVDVVDCARVKDVLGGGPSGRRVSRTRTCVRARCARIQTLTASSRGPRARLQDVQKVHKSTLGLSGKTGNVVHGPLFLSL